MDVPRRHRTCLVTGGAGFIGRQLLEALVSTSAFDRIVSLDVVETPGVENWIDDIRTPISAQDAPHSFTDCIHLAALAKEPGFPHQDYFATNLQGTRHVLSLCSELGVERVVNLSTMMVFPAGEMRYHEHDVVAPDTAYGSSKALAEIEVQRWADAVPARSATTLRPAVVFGPDDVGNFERLRGALQKRRFAYVGRRDTVKSCVAVDDVVRAILWALDRDDARTVYHVALPHPTTIEQIVRAVVEEFGYPAWVPTVPFWSARLAAGALGVVGAFGRETAIHPRRIEKLYRSTNLAADAICEDGFTFSLPDLQTAVAAWHRGLSDLSRTRVPAAV